MALQFKKCKTCGRVFQTAFDGLECPDCVEERERKFEKVKEFLYRYPGASMEEIIEETEVDPKLILRFLKEGRLEMMNAAGLLTCEKCGAPITSGTMCAKCKDKLSRAMQSVLPKAPEPVREKKSPLGSTKADKLHVNVHGR